VEKELTQSNWRRLKPRAARGSGGPLG
jgi:hypothetical protein